MLRSLDHPNWVASSWQLLLIFYAFCLGVFVICAFGNRLLPYVDTVASVWNAVTIVVVLIGLSATANVGRHSAADTLGYYDTSISGWGGFSFFIGLLPAAYTYAAVGMIASMAEEVRDATVVSNTGVCVILETQRILQIMRDVF
jgi:amino acid transporter